MSVSLLPEESDQSLAFLQFEEQTSSNDNINTGTIEHAVHTNEESEDHLESNEADLDEDMNFAATVSIANDDICLGADSDSTNDLLSEQEHDMIEAAFEENVRTDTNDREEENGVNGPCNTLTMDVLKETEGQAEFQAAFLSTAETEMDDLVNLVRDVDIDIAASTVLNNDMSREDVNIVTANQVTEGLQENQLFDTNASHQKVVPNPLATKLVSSFTVQTTTEKMALGRPKSASSVVDRLSKPKNTSNKVLDASKSVVLSSEDLVIAKIKEEKKARVAQMARSKRVGGRTSAKSRSSQPTYMAAKQSCKPPAATASKKSPTSRNVMKGNKTARFMMSTSSSKRADIAAVKDKTGIKLSSSVVIAKKGHGGVTIPEPFKFTTKNKTNDKLVGCKSPVMTLAVQARLFESNVLRTSSVSSSRVFSQDMKLTVAKSPKFHAIHSKPAPQSSEQKEVSLITTKPAFKHNPVNRKIMQSMGEMGVPKVESRPLTEPKPFQFRVDQRSTRTIRSSSSTAPSSSSTKTRSPRIFRRPKVISPRNRMTKFVPGRLTVPISPKLSGSTATAAPARRQLPHHSQVEAQRKQLEQASQQSICKHSKLKSTVPKPFNFLVDQRGALYQQQFEAKVKAEQEELSKSAVRSVSHVPNFNKPLNNSAVQHRPPTEFKEFALKSAIRHELSVHELNKNINEQMSKVKEMSNFKAQPAPEFSKPREVPKSARKPVTKVISPTFESSKRAERRKSFDKKVRQSMVEKEMQLAIDAEQKAEEENRNINIMRRKSVSEGGLMYKAKEILREDPYPVGNPEYRPLTEPLSPMLMTKMRAESQSAIKEATFQPTFPL